MGFFSIPKHVLISWMAILNRLPTIDHLEAWGMDVTRLCRLCQNEKESKDHLYFCCKFSKVIQGKALQLSGLRRTIGRWDEKLKWVSVKLKGKALISIVLRTAWKATIYYIQRERNRRIYGQIPESTSKLFYYVKEAVQLKTWDLVNIADDSVNRSLYKNWEL